MKSLRVTESPAVDPWLIMSSGKGNISRFLEQGGARYYSFHASGRAALLEGLKLLKISPDENILLPGYICNTATIPFRHLGIKMKFYDILPSLEPDMGSITGKIDDKTKGIMVVNYFGFPQNLGPINELCEKFGLFLIEDNSHSMLSKDSATLLGTRGDIGFSSIYKELPAPNGGILYVNSDNLIPGTSGSPEIPKYAPVSDGLYLLSSGLRYLETRFGIPTWIIRIIYQRIYPSDTSMSEKNISIDAAISRITHEVMKKMDAFDIINKRRSNYEQWLKILSGRKSVKIVFKDVSEGVCPWMFPVVVDDSGIVDEIGKRGIEVNPWPVLPPEVRGKNDLASYLSTHLYILPVHQYVNQKYLG